MNHMHQFSAKSAHIYKYRVHSACINISKVVSATASCTLATEECQNFKNLTMTEIIDPDIFKYELNLASCKH